MLLSASRRVASGLLSSVRGSELAPFSIRAKAPVNPWSDEQKQHTLKGRTELMKGIGLHTGERCQVSLVPAPARSGIRFLQAASVGMVNFFTTPECVTNTTARTALGGLSLHSKLGLRKQAEGIDGTVIQEKEGITELNTVEHVLAALRLAGVDNAVVEVAGPEIPIFDGSARDWLQAISKVGLRRQDADRAWVRVLEPVRVEGLGGSWVELHPVEDDAIPGLQFGQVSIDFPAPLGHQVWNGEGSGSVESGKWVGGLLEEIGHARTFTMASAIPSLRSIGLIQGGNEDNAVVFADGVKDLSSAIVAGGPLRTENEPVKHKVLDAIGDLAVNPLGRVWAKYSAHKPGHGLHHELMLKLLSEPSYFRVDSGDGADEEL